MQTHHISDHATFAELFEQVHHILPDKKIVIFIDEFDGIPYGALNMGAILADFEEYIVHIGINAFYERQKPYEKTGKYLLPERASEGYLVIFDLKTTTGEHLEPQQHLIEGKTITSVVIGIRRPSEKE